jgi:hypothetical protein
MNILIVSEKPWLSRIMAPAVRAHWPADHISFVHAVPYGNFTFHYPRGLRLQDYPVVSEPRHKLRDWDDWCCGALDMAPDGTLVDCSANPALFTAADLIVYACDPDHSGAVSFDVLMHQVFGDDRALHCPALLLVSADDASLKRALAEMRPFGQACRQSREYGHMKRYVDWNWNANALAVLGETQRRAGVPADAPPLSKFALQMLYAMRDGLPRSDNALHRLMTYWPGTGRYQYEAGQWRPRVGSAASRAQILENLIEAGLLTRTFLAPKRPLGEFEQAPSELSLSACGQALLNLLHPDCEDPDLPFRLHAWCEKGATAKPAVDRYIKTFFGKQLRFLSA